MMNNSINLGDWIASEIIGDANDRLQLFMEMYRESKTPQERLELERERIEDYINHSLDNYAINIDEYEVLMNSLNAWYAEALKSIS